MPTSFSRFARGVTAETAFSVLAIARKLKAAGKRVIELEIGDSPFPSSSSARAAGIEAIQNDQGHYCPAAGIPDLRQAAAEYLRREHSIQAEPGQILVAPGAKPFEQFFCEAFLDPGDGVLVFSPRFPTYEPNIARRGARPVFVSLRVERDFRPDPVDVERFLAEDPRPRAIFLNTPHNPTGGVATKDDIQAIADLVRGRDIAVFSDEPYDQMIWTGRHHSIAVEPNMLDQCVAAYTFSKSYSMSGWRLGFCVSSVVATDLMARLLNTTLSCVPPFVQLAGAAALRQDDAERDAAMQDFRRKVKVLADGLNQLDGVRARVPDGTFYVFPDVREICNRLRITSHGLAMHLLEGADDRLGVACLGGECFGDAGGGFIRFSCAEPDAALAEAVSFFSTTVGRADRVAAWLSSHPTFRLERPYAL